MQKMRRFPRIILALVLGVPAAAGAQSRVPVEVGGDASLDACASIGVVSGLDPDGAGVLRVRSGPGTEHAPVDRVAGGQLLWICAQDGAWLGVVYTRNETECGVANPIPARRDYVGPCRSGWVSRAYVSAVAG
jgi:hypothetical protein